MNEVTTNLVCREVLSAVSKMGASGVTFPVLTPNIKVPRLYKYTIRSIVCEASHHLVTHSLGHLVTWSLGYSVT